MKKKVVIIGAGYAGSCFAKMFSRNYSVAILEKEKVPGGLCRSYYLDGMTYEFGPHILANHNCSQKAINFIKNNVSSVKTSMTSASFVRGKFTYYPPCKKNAELLNVQDQVEQDLKGLPEIPREDNFENYLIDKVGQTLYEIYFKEFTEKFWKVKSVMLSAEWAKVRHLGDSLTDKRIFFNKKWCAYPKKDWNELFKNLLKGIDVRYNTAVERIDFNAQEVIIKNGERIKYDLLLSTLSIDELFENRLGQLRYSGYEIAPKILRQDCYASFNSKPISMTYFPEKRYPYTRITDYKTFQKKDKSSAYHGRIIVTVETPSKKHKLYPFMDEANETLFDDYVRIASDHPQVISLGRKGLYKYLTIDTTTEMILRLRKYLVGWDRLNPSKRYKAYQEIRGDWSN
ncbi:UDP-galactopyranose mutase [Candidatus Omnitrophota bacterium]